MNRAYFHCLIENNKPRCCAFKIEGQYEYFELFRPGAKKPIKVINDTIKEIINRFNDINDSGVNIVLSDFLQFLKIFSINAEDIDYNIYDIHMLELNSLDIANSTFIKDKKVLRTILDKFEGKSLHEYQKLLSNSAIVYKDMTDRGIIVNDTIFNPQWSLNTFSGRSKSLGFNIQGHHTDDKVRSITSSEDNILLHFDWVSADIRVASILSQDKNLIKSFEDSDPYTFMMHKINNNDLKRDECKLFLLKSINSMSNNDIIDDLFPSLSKWIISCRNITRDEKGYLDSILDRRFKVSKAKNQLAVLNGIMQGSVAHAMHNSIRKIWNKLGSYLIADIHDSIVLSVPNDGPLIRSVISIVSDIMTKPYEGIINGDCYFPVRVSIGKRWKNWKLFEIHRKGGIERVK